MLDVDWDVHALEGAPPASDPAEPPDCDTVALVAAVVTNETPVPRRIRLAAAGDASVLPPRRQGIPAAGWDDGGYEGVVPAEGHLALGFATRGDPPDPPGEVQDRGRADGDGGDTTPGDLLRALGSPAPPREAVPVPDVGDDAMGDAVADDGTEDSKDETASGPNPGEAVPTHVGAWLDAVADRVDRGATEPGDRAALERVAERASALASATAGTDR